MKIKKPLTAIGSIALALGILVGCSQADKTTASTTTESSEVSSVEYTGVLTSDAIMSENEDYTTTNNDEWDSSTSETITLNGNSIDTTSDAATVSDNVLTITEGGVYTLTGEFNGQINIDAGEDEQVVLILDNATITNDSGSAIVVTQADDVAIYLAEGSTNTVSDSEEEYADDAETNAAIYSNSDLTIAGTGELLVKANGGDAIVSKDDLVILEGNITIDALDDVSSGETYYINGQEVTAN